jgi:hypothetical protein
MLEALTRFKLGEGRDQRLCKGFGGTLGGEPDPGMPIHQFDETIRRTCGDNRQAGSGSLKECVGKPLMVRGQNKKRRCGKVCGRGIDLAWKSDRGVESESLAESLQSMLFPAGASDDKVGEWESLSDDGE